MRWSGPICTKSIGSDRFRLFRKLFNLWKSLCSYLTLHHALVRFTGDVDLIDGPAQVIEEEGPVAGSQIYFAWLPGFCWALLSSFLQQGRCCSFAIQPHRLNHHTHTPFTISLIKTNFTNMNLICCNVKLITHGASH